MNYLHIFLGGIVMFKILIAEDDIELCRLFSPVLSKKGYCVKCFSNGQEALNELDRDYFDLIISDITESTAIAARSAISSGRQLRAI